MPKNVSTRQPRIKTPAIKIVSKPRKGLSPSPKWDAFDPDGRPNPPYTGTT